MNTVPTMAALSINTSHVGYDYQRQETPLGTRFQILAVLAGGRRKELALVSDAGTAQRIITGLAQSLGLLHGAGKEMARDKSIALCLDSRLS